MDSQRFGNPWPAARLRLRLQRHSGICCAVPGIDPPPAAWHL